MPVEERGDQRDERREQLLGFLALHDERRQQPHHVVRGHVDEQPLVERLLHELAARMLELDADHQPPAAYLLDALRVAEPPRGLAAYEVAHFDRVLHQPLVLDDGERGERGGAGKGIAAEGRAVVAGLEQLRGWAGREARPDRHAVGEPLGKRHDVRHHTGVLVREPFPGAAGAALHLVEHQQPAVRLADLAQALEVIVVADDDPAFALQQLDQHRHHAAVRLRDALHRVEVVERHPHEAGDQGLEARLYLAAAGGGQRGNGAAVESLVHDHDGGGLDVLLVAVEPRELDRRLVCLAAGVAEEDVVHAGDRGQPVGEFLLQRDLVEVRGVDELAHLLAQRGGEFWMAVPEPAHRDPGHGVKVALAVRIPQPAALAALEGDGEPGISIHHVRHGLNSCKFGLKKQTAAMPMPP